MTGELKGIAGTAAAPGFTFVGDLDTGIYSPSANTIGFTTGGTEKVRINSSGYVGIGTSSPSFPLDIQSSGTFQARLYHASNNANDGSALMMTRTRGTVASGSAVQSGDVLGGFYFRGHDGSGANTTSSAIEVLATENFSGTNRGTSMIFETTSTGAATRAERMRISGTGNVGIGTNSPNGKLDVKGSLVLSGSTSGYTGFQPAAVAGSTIWTLPSADGTTGQVLTTNGSGVLSWSTPSSGGLTSLNGLTAGTQTFAIGSTGTAPAFSSTTSTHTLNIPMASASSVTAGLISKTEYDNFNSKLSATITTPSSGQYLKYDGANWINSVLSVDLTSQVTGALPIANGGTGATTAAAARTNLGLGTAAEKNTGVTSGNVPLVGVAGITNNSMCTSDGSGAITCTTAIPSASGDFKADGTVAMTGQLRGIAGTASAPGLAIVGDTNTGIYAPAADTLAISSAGTERMRITSTGSVAIGSSSPNSGIGYTADFRVLGISGGGATSPYSSGLLQLSNNSPTPAVNDIIGRIDMATVNQGSGVSQIGAQIFGTLGGVGGANGFGTNLELTTRADNVALLPQTRMFIEHTGNIGINTKTPDANTKLQVNGVIASAASVNDASPTSFNMAAGNFQYTTTACSGATWDLTNIAEGTSYTIAVQNATHTGACVFSMAGSTANVRYQPANAMPVSGHAVYTFIKVGSFLYVSWVDGFQ